MAQSSIRRSEICRLFVPCRPEHKKAVEWRIKFAQTEQPELLKRITPFFSGFNRPLSEKDKKELLSIAKSKELALDDIELTVLYAGCTLLHKWDKISLKELFKLDPPLRIMYEQKISEKSLDFVKRKKQVKKYIHAVYQQALCSARAKMAIQELIACLSRLPENFFLLIAFTPRYLKCDYVQEWIHKWRFDLLHKEPHRKKSAKKYLEKISVELFGNTKIKSQKRDYWRLWWEYKSIVRWIWDFKNEVFWGMDIKDSGERKRVVAPREAWFKWWLKDMGCSDYETIIRNSDDPKTLAREILCNKESISEDTFEKIAGRCKKMERRHPILRKGGGHIFNLYYDFFRSDRLLTRAADFWADIDSISLSRGT